jgi:hypothetical protein
MQDTSMICKASHYFAVIDGNNWLIDTGAPSSFSDQDVLELDGVKLSLLNNYMGLDAKSLSAHVGSSIHGLIGTDILAKVDIRLDARKNEVTFSANQLPGEADRIQVSDFMGIPIVEVEIDGGPRRMFLDTGAQICYFQSDSLSSFPAAGALTDFFPGMGQFETDTHTVPVIVGKQAFRLRCGSLPGLLGMTLLMADVEGIVGNEIMANKVLTYSARRSELSIG